MAGDLFVSANDTEEFPLDMEESKLQALVMSLITVEKETVRDRAAKNHSFKQLFESPRFQTIYAKMVGCDRFLPPTEYLEKLLSDKEEFPYMKKSFKFNLQDIVFDKTRHGYGEVDIPFDSNHGVVPVQDLGGCESSVPLRSVFVLENMNVPVCRFDPIMFAQSWVLALLRPKFRFKGLIACPKGDYGLARLIVEVGNARGQTVRSEKSVPFKIGESERLGNFIPFEVMSPDYEFRPVHVFFFVCIFYVNRVPMENRGMRVANCTVQCVLPEMPQTLDSIENSEPFPADVYDAPPHACNYTIENSADPLYLKQLKANFFSCLDNMKTIRAEQTARAEKDISRLMGSNLLEDKMEDDDYEEISDKRKRENSIGEEEPEIKRRC